MLDQENSYDVTELSKYVEHAIYTRQFDPMFEFDHQKSTTSYNDQYCCPSAKSMLIRYLLPYLNSVVRFRLLDHLSLWKHILRLTVRKGEFLIVKLLNRICRYFALKVERQRTRLSSDIHDMQLSVHRSEYFNEHCEHQHFVLFQQCLERPLTLEVSKALGNSKLLIQNGFLDRYSQSKHRYIKTYIFLTDSYIFLCSVNTNGKRTSSLKQSVRLPFSQTINSEYQQYNNNLYSLKYLCAIENIEVNEQYVTSVNNTRKQKEKHKWIGSILFAQNRIRYQHDLQHITAMKYNEIPLLSPSESFTCEDSSSNIIIDAANQIKAATFEKYFEKATCPLMGGNLNLLNSFLSCYRLYRKPDYVLDLALRRYAVSEPTIDSIVDNSNASKSEMLEKYNVEVMIPVQIRVLNFLKIWLDQYVFEAERNCFDALSQRILQFINSKSLC
ncbi:hypothetical protein GJ496_003886 [Pomphorhynchus laevis]|nr:hypothetical protein GJ496_003886 [Pomphorhynchus laevis]